MCGLVMWSVIQPVCWLNGGEGLLSDVARCGTVMYAFYLRGGRCGGVMGAWVNMEGFGDWGRWKVSMGGIRG